MGIPEIKSVVSRLGREYGAQRIWLFGSYARGDVTPTSDIDLRIDKGRIRGIEMGGLDRNSTRLNSSHNNQSRMPSSA